MKKLVILFVISGLALPAIAANITWLGGVGNWSDPNFWDSGTVPGSADSAYVKSGEAQVIGTVTQVVNDIRPTTGGAIRIVSGGTLTSNQAKIGANGGNGTLYIEPGATYNHIGSGTNFEVGKTDGRTDYVIQTGGVATFKGARIELGDDVGDYTSRGIYTITGGVLDGQCTTVYAIGNTSYGELNISGTAQVNMGTPSRRTTTVLGYGEGATGRINISGGQVYFSHDVITGYTGLQTCGEGNAYFKVDGSGSAGDFIRVSRQFKLDRGASSTVEFVLDSGGIIPIQACYDYKGDPGQASTGFFVDADTTVILDTKGIIGAAVGDKYILATGNQVNITGAVIQDNSFFYDFALNVLTDYVDPETGITIKALELEITAAPVGTITETDGITKVYEEGETSDTFTVVLNSQPTSDVTVTIDPWTTGDFTIDPNTLIFTPDNWYIPQEVTVTAFDGAGYEASDENGNPEEEILVSLTTTSSDPAFDGKPLGQLVVISVDNECGPGRYLPGDADQNCEVNLADVATMASYWLECSIPGRAGCLEPWTW